MKIKLYQILSEKEINKFLKSIGYNSSINNLLILEIKNEDMFGDFIIIEDYYFKKIYSEYQCLKTPTEEHKKQKANIIKNPNDSRNYK